MKYGMLGQISVGAVETRACRIDSKREQGFRGRFRNILGVGLGMALVWSVAGCHQTLQAATSQTSVDQNGADPADANMAQVGGSGVSYAPARGTYVPAQPERVMGQTAQNEAQQQAQEYSQQSAPIERRAPYSGNQSYNNGGYDNGQVGDRQAVDLYESDLTDEEANEAPPPLPDYEQPPAPYPDYLWTPGYWSWGPGGYYWVPGCWVSAPYRGALWTPGYWGFYIGNYRFHHGYWGLHIGFYGGVDYGYGYIGHGYYGGYWDHDHFRYNTAVNRIDNDRIRNVYARNVVVNNVVINYRIGNRVSFNGGRDGVRDRPREAELAVLHERRIPPMASQVQVQHEAAQDRQQFFNQNRGRPAMVVSARPVIADRTLPAELPRATGSVGQPGGRGDSRPGQTQQGRPQFRQGLPAPQDRQQGQPQPQLRQGQPAPQDRQQGQPQPQLRQAQPRPQEQARPQQPAPQQQAQPRPQEQARPQQPAPQQQAQPQNQARPQHRDAPQRGDSRDDGKPR